MIKELYTFCLACPLIPIIGGQKFPSLFGFPQNKTTINGSSETGNCTSIDDMGAICNDPTSSVLFDGIIPTLTGLDGNMWASQLLTINSRHFGITFIFSETPDFVGVRRVEIVLFNCLEWGISVQSITLQTSSGFAGTINPAVTSCDSLVRVCIGNLNTNSAQKELTLQFSIISSEWLHIAEVTFYGAGPTCPDDAAINKPTTGDITTSAVSTSIPPTSVISSVAEATVTITHTFPMDSDPGTIAGGVIVAILAIIAIATVVIIVTIYFTRPSGKEAFTNFQNSFKLKLGTKRTNNVETTPAHYTLNPSRNNDKDIIYNQLEGIGRKIPLNTAGEKVDNATSLYSVVDMSEQSRPPQWSTEDYQSEPFIQQPVDQIYSVVDSIWCKPRESVEQEVDSPKPPQQSVEQNVYVVIDKSKRTKPEEYTTVLPSQ